MLERLVDRVLGLPEAEVPNPVVLRDLEIPMPDGVRLLADRHTTPGGEPRPVVLIRTPYGRRGLLSKLFGQSFARRGLQTVIQSTRGTFGSGGEFRPFHLEREDGLATIDWLRAQPWCDGRLAMAGASYLGHTQWAVAGYLDPPLEAMCLAITASEFTSAFYPGGVLAADDMVSWSALIGRQEERFAGLPNPVQDRRTRRAMAHLPVNAADVAAIGRPVRFLQDVAAHGEPGDEFWAPSDHRGTVAGLTTPTSMVTGWYDLFLSGQLRDFKELRAAGRTSRITIGPWSHGEPASLKTLIGDQVSWLSAHLLDDRSQLQQSPVRLYLQQASRWLDFDHWPPKSTATPLYLRSIGGLAHEPAESTPDRFTYDPADPTPSVGGPLLMGANKQRDNQAVEARDDVLVFTGTPLDNDLDVIGEVSARVYLRTDLGHADVFVRLCDVDKRGVSRNVTDGILRLRPGAPEADADGVVTAEVSLSPTAYRFRRGHRLRLQVAGGAFPRFVRNHGTGQPAGEAVDGKPCRFELFHDPARPSQITLPVFTG
ncbi:CocE/NonD family hydrolase [Amycolatopsis sp. H20-H5]|uniref:CocE/NonD family hydrolase n=1 Tax=Amycolatopsis sp. H20-H5 TaxID=3046309 RepID=UPI002DBD6394|nr:CocE/NonD family hydrolase [Amycolatopsis sp. H20-H5]MEC3979418.1 CocE/NonD family hydrolase [Amycolatopsis sp. H20-H5]